MTPHSLPSTIVVPCFNEAKRLDINELARLAGSGDLRLLLVDDGSTDDTRAVMECLCARSNGRATALLLDRNAGKAEAVRRGLLRAMDEGAAIVGFLDADLSTPVDEALRLVETLHAHPQVEVLLGSRVRLLGNAVERKPLRHYLGRVFATAASLTLSLEVYDTQCGAKFFRATEALRSALNEPFHSRWIFDVELLGRLLQGTSMHAGLREEAFLEVPLHAWRDVAGSKLGPAPMLRAVGELARIRGALRDRARLWR